VSSAWRFNSYVGTNRPVPGWIGGGADQAWQGDENDGHRRCYRDGRKLRRYKRRWCVERLLAGLRLFRRLVTRYEYHIENFLGMVRLGCMRIMLRYL
jgi:transposase